MFEEEIPLVTTKEIPEKRIAPLYKLYISEVIEKPNFLQNVKNYQIQICGEIVFIHRVSNKYFAITVEDNTGKILTKKFEKEDRIALIDDLASNKIQPKTQPNKQLEDFVFEASRLSLNDDESVDQESNKLVFQIADWLFTEIEERNEFLKEGRKVLITGVLREQEESYISIFDYRMLDDDVDFHDIQEEFKHLHEAVYK